VVEVVGEQVEADVRRQLGEFGVGPAAIQSSLPCRGVDLADVAGGLRATARSALSLGSKWTRFSRMATVCSSLSLAVLPARVCADWQ
jgi:hypothetical protein